VSKNVAVFVDVANIFYAAKAAGVDIDYTTLLKSATAGRDFVRAYAYTGLDPDNENQRQFHGFLARSGYRVVSKDIRKYGDGKVKANLDIELVVDLMKTSRNLDVAVIVSGDGDFAPAIRAVQEMGVRCEVISFRGNTSSDLMDVADVFTDITQIARVEKGTGRSGRRVAAEGDLSMTEVPDKETEGAPRRRGGRRRTGERDTHTREPRERDVEREPAAAAASGARPNLVVLPGEKLSRVAAAPEDEIDELPEPVEVGADAVETLTPVAVGDTGDTNGAEPETEEGRRRRRRRGGRGRGRGRGDQVAPAAAGAPGDPVLPEEDEDVDYEPPRMPQHSTFGSVWDSQLGVPSAPAAAAGATPGAPTGDEEFDDEPEIPEYLLAERRQRGRGNRGPNPRGGGRGGRAGAYQAAVQRERYGRGGAPGGGFSGPRRDDRPFGRPNQGTPQSQPHRPAPFSASPPAATGGNVANGGGSDPWSEVPPEIEAMLRAELARKGGAPAAPAAPVSAPDQADDEETAQALGVAGTADVAGGVTETPAVGSSAAEPEAPKRRARRTRATAATEAAPETAVTEAPTAEAAADEAAPKRRTRRTKATAEAESAATPATEASADASVTPEAGAAPKRRTRRTAAAAAPEQSDEAAGHAEADAAPAPKRRTRRTKATAEGEASGSEA
jgi:uncharacterized LabA/DUF88 family protein